METGLTTKRNDDRPRKSKSKKKSSRGSDRETVESEDSAEESENGETVSDKKKNKKQGKNNQKKKDKGSKGNKGNNIPEFQFTECTEYFLDFEQSEDHNQNHHSGDNLVITHITVHLDDANRERIKVKCCQLVFT